MMLESPIYGPSVIPKLSKLDVRIPSGGGHQLKISKGLSPIFRGFLNNSKKMALAISLIPSCLGGYPIFMSSELIMHGFPDILCL